MKKNLPPQWLSLGAIFALFFVTPGVSQAVVDFQQLEPTTAHADGMSRVIIMYPKAVQKANLDVLQSLGSNVHHRFSSIPGVAVTMPTIAVEMFMRAGVAEIYPDTQVHIALDESVPQINAPQVHAYGVQGAGAKVCIVDTGVDDNHPALPSMVAEFDFANDDADATDDHGHGTHVAGIALSRNSAFKGVAPAASLMAAKVLGSGGSGNTSDVIAGIEWCTQNGADVINLSLGHGSFSGACDSDPSAKAVNVAVDAGVAVFAASGNDRSSTRIGAPACASKAVAVGSVTKSDVLASYSNGGTELDIVAPGSSITSTFLNGDYRGYSGTSMASPHAAGLAALLLSVDPSLTPDQVRTIIQSTAVDLGSPGFDTDYGYGRIDALAAYNSVLNGPPPTPDVVFSEDLQGSFSQWTQNGWLIQSPAERAVPSSITGNKVAHASDCDNECSLTLGSPIDLTGYENATLTFQRYVDRSIDRNEYLELQIYNGSVWETVAHWTNRQGDDDVWHTESVNLNQYLVQNFKIRFNALMNSSNEDAEIDNIRIEGVSSTGEPPPPLPPPPNIPPTANAGADQTHIDNNEDGFAAVNLDGTGSSDPDGTIVSYEWTENGTLVGTGSISSVLLPIGVHTITLTVTDDDGATDTDTIVITVNEVTPTPNIPPTADAGPDQTLADNNEDGSEILTLDGTGSSDSDGVIVSYNWTENGNFVATGSLAQVTLPVGVHTITLEVTDDDGATSTDTVVITVNATDPPPPPPPPSGDLFSDDFESGLSNWTNIGWQVQDPAERDVPGSPGGNNVAHASDCDDECILTLSSPIDLIGFTNVTLTFKRYVDRSIDRNEYLAVDVFNGSMWINIYTWTHRNGDDDTWYDETADLSSYISNSFKVRFRSLSSSRNEDAEIDDVVISGLAP